VAIVDLIEPLTVGQNIHIKGANDDFTQPVLELQYEREQIQQGGKGQSVGIKVNQKVHENDRVFLVE